jgi:organic hydroperoxide reductase OsmC/OhrA
MADTAHHYHAELTWSGGQLTSARDYKNYSRAFTVAITGKPALTGSADPAFLGDPRELNPEELLLISLSSCHMLSYLALCSNSGITVRSYRDSAQATMTQSADRNFAFSQAVLHPQVVIEPGGDHAKAVRLHLRAHEVCFIARSVNFPVSAEPTIEVASA